MSTSSLKQPCLWLLSLGLVLSFYTLHIQASQPPQAPLSCWDKIFNLNGLRQLEQPALTGANAVRAAFALFVFYSIYRLYTKKPTNEVAHPKYDPSLPIRTLNYIKYVYDEKILGMIGKPERPDHVDPDTGKIVYSKIKERGALGTLATYWKDLIIPVMTFAVIWKTFFNKTLPEAAKDTMCLFNFETIAVEM